MANEQYRVIIKTGPNPGRAFDLNKDSMTIGREATCDIVIQDPEISRVHSRISKKGGAFVVEDAGSTNGTFVRGQRVMAPRALTPGDEIGIGDTVVLIYQGDGAAATVVASSAFQQGSKQQGQAYYAPAPAPAPAKTSGGSRPMILGCGCLVVVCIAAIVAAFLFDYLALYCVTPFDMVFGALGYCPVP